MIGTIIKAACFFALAAPALAAPIADADLGVLQYALVLEHLENEFYAEGLAKFDEKAFTDAGHPGVRSELVKIAAHEKTHVDILGKVITATGNTPVPKCVYKFGFTTVDGFLALGRALERTGVSAYDGALHKIVEDGYKTAAATIATIEARHASYLNNQNGLSGFPEAFDTPLGMQAIVTIAASVIESCPFELPIKPFPSLSATPATGPASGDLTLTFAANSSAVACTFLYGAAQTFSELKDNKCKIPAEVTGDVYVFATWNGTTPISLDDASSVIAGPAVYTVNNFALEVKTANTTGKLNSTGGTSAGQKSVFAGASAALLGVASMLYMFA